MTSILRLMGFPNPEKRDSVKFHFAKTLPYNARITLMFFLLVIGFGLQLYFMSPFYGAPFLIIGIGLVLVKGYDSRIRIVSFNQDPSWKTVTINEIEELESLRKRSRKWDRDALDISNTLGFFSLIFFSGLAFAASIALGIFAKEAKVSLILAVDTVILIAPIWFTGMKFILKQPNLAIQVDILLKLYEEFEELKKEGEEFKPALMLGKGKENKTVPFRTRFSIAFPDPPEGFYGLQAQINLNVVQGASFPYFYCVLAAKPGFKMLSFKDKIKLEKDIICEYQKDGRAEVLVIRQRTTRKSGYHTKDRRCTEILEVALKGGRIICSQKQ